MLIRRKTDQRIFSSKLSGRVVSIRPTSPGNAGMSGLSSGTGKIMWRRVLFGRVEKGLAGAMHLAMKCWSEPP